jgi:hypothetical protein
VDDAQPIMRRQGDALKIGHWIDKMWRRLIGLQPAHYILCRCQGCRALACPPIEDVRRKSCPNCGEQFVPIRRTDSTRENR